MASFTSIQIERFKREAKLLRRASSLSHSQALDQIANVNGYGNWSLLMKHNAPGGTREGAAPRPYLMFTRTPALMRVALHKVPELRSWGAPKRSESAQQQVADISHSFVSPQNVVAFAIDYMTCLLTVPRFKLYAAAPAYWEMRAWLPYACKEVRPGVDILVNRSYKPVGQVDDAWANYEEFPHLQVQLADSLRQTFSARPTSPDYLFNDGCPPWNTRADAVAYLERLKRLQVALNG